MLVVVGGHSRNVGKTSVAAGLIAATRELGWTALAYSSNRVEYRSGTNGNWQVLTNFLHGPYTSPVRILEAIPNNGTRVYRLRVERGPFFQ